MTSNVMRDMVLIPSGTYVMGSDESPFEQPTREVLLAAFLIDRHPVTNVDYLAFMADGGYFRREFWRDAGWNFAQQRVLTEPLYWQDDYWNGNTQPVTGVSWYEASAYATWAEKVLPTEAQWECAARGRDARRYPWGNAEPSSLLALYAVDCDPDELRRRSAPVDAHPDGTSPFGCVDMAGNVGEW